MTQGIKKALRGGLLGLSALGLALFFFSRGWLDVFENKSWDLRARIGASPEKASQEILLILLDQNSLDWAEEHLNLNWPWPREIYGAVTSFCTRNRARALGFDVIFSEASIYGVDDDKAFAAALKGAGNTALAAVLGKNTGRDKHWPEALARQALLVPGMETLPLEFRGVTLPIPELAEPSVLLSNVNLAPDRDGIYRRLPLVTRFDTIALPSLGLGTFLSARENFNLISEARIENQDLFMGRSRIPLDDTGSVILNYRGPSGTHKVCSAAWILQEELKFRAGEPLSKGAGEMVRDKYVFFGFSAPGLFDIHSTPMDSQSPGVEIHATLLDNFLSQDFIARPPLWTGPFFAALLCLALGILGSLYTRALPQLAIVSSGLALPLAGGLLGYKMGYWMPVALPLTAGGMTLALVTGVNYATEGRRRRFVKRAFNHYLSAQVIDQILQDPGRLRLGGERRNLSIFFSDLESFTSLSESMAPEDLVKFLNEYLTAMTDIIHNLKGTIDKYEGDAIIAFWNAPLETENHAQLAVRAAIECQAALARMRPRFREFTGKEVRMRIGINSGPAVVGNLGSNTRFDYTMIGDAVNLAARLESGNKHFNTYTMVSEETKNLAGPGILYRNLGRITVKGRETPVRVYQPLGMTDPGVTDQGVTDQVIAGPDIADQGRDPVPEEVVKTFEQGLALFEKGEFHRAGQQFDRIRHIDPPAGVYRDLCREYEKHPPKDWAGIFPFSSK